MVLVCYNNPHKYFNDFFFIQIKKLCLFIQQIPSYLKGGCSNLPMGFIFFCDYHSISVKECIGNTNYKWLFMHKIILDDGKPTSLWRPHFTWKNERYLYLN